MKTINYLLESLVDTFKYRWKMFLVTVVVQLILTVLLNLGVNTPDMMEALVFDLNVSKAGMASPLPVKTDLWDQIKIKLEQKGHDFQLKRDSSWVKSAHAASGAAYDDVSAYLVLDYDTGEILAEKEAGKKLSIASLTKIMTAVTALDLTTPQEDFTVSPKAALIQPTKIGVVPGQKMTVEELLHALMLTSANDAAGVIREGVDQKYLSDVFVRAMNEKAQFLGMKSSSFANPQGFDHPKNYSSAEDLAILAHYALEKYPLFSQVVKKDYQKIPANNFHKQFDLYNWNGLIGVYPGAYGVKIGNTDEAKVTTVVAAEREGKRVLVVLLGAPGALERDLWAAQLLDLGFGKLGVSPAEITEGQLQWKYSTWKYWG